MEDKYYLFVRLSASDKLEFKTEKADNDVSDRYVMTKDCIQTFLKSVDRTSTDDMIQALSHFMILSEEFQKIKRIDIE